MNASKTVKKSTAKGKSSVKGNARSASTKTTKPTPEETGSTVHDAESMESSTDETKLDATKDDDTGEIPPGKEPGKSDQEPSDSERLVEANEQIMQLKDRYLRVNAEFENYKKRMIRENSERFKYYNLELVKQFLPSIDNLERAIIHAANGDSSTESMIEGLELVYKEMQEVFTKFGVTKIKALGEVFDPNRHQAVGMVESDAVPENHVAEECLTGYLLHDRIIRPTMVRVSGK